MDESYSEGNGITELLGIIKNHIVLLLVVFTTIVALSVGYLLVSTTYIATTTISVEPIASMVRNTGTKSTFTNIVNEILYLNNSSVVAKALSSMDLGAYTRKDGTDYSDLLLEQNKLNSLTTKIKTSAIKDTNQVTVTFEHANPVFAKAFVAALNTAFDVTLLEISTEQLDKEQGLLETMLGEAKNGLAAAELARDEFQSEPRYIEYAANNGSYHRILNYLEIQLRDVEPNVIAADASKPLENLGITDPTSARLVEAYGLAFRKLLYFEIAQLINPIKSSEVESKDYYLEFYRDNLEDQRLALLDHLYLINGQADAEVYITQITNTVKYSFLSVEKLYYLDSLKEFRAIGLIEDQNSYEINQYKDKVVQYTNQLDSFEGFRTIAVNPTSIIKPVEIKNLDGRNTKTPLILAVGLFMGLALGFLCILLYDIFSDSLMDELGIKKLVWARIPIWTTIPKIQGKKNYTSSELGIYADPVNKTSEAFDRLAGIVQHSGTSNGSNVYCFSSLGYNESGVSIVLNLAFSIMMNGKKVLVIGTNNKETMYHDIYDSIVASDPSVTRVSLEKIGLGTEKKTDTKLPLLHLVSIDGKPHELSVILNSEAFTTTVQSASEAYDIILIDGPTFRSPSNLLAVAKNSAGLVLNVRQGIASKRAMKQLLVTVSISHVPILGIVFNAMFGKPSMLEKHRIHKQRYNASLSVSKMWLPIQENKK